MEIPTSNPYTRNPGFFYRVEEEVTSVASSIAIGAKKVVAAIGKVQIDANAFGRLLKLTECTFSAIEIAIKKPTFHRVRAIFSDARGCVDAAQTLDGISYFAGDKPKEDSWYNIIGNGAMFAVSACLFASLLDRCELISLGAAELAMGKAPVIGVVFRKVSFGMFVSGLSVFGFGCFGANAIDNIVHSETKARKRQSGLELVWFISEIVATIFEVVVANYLGMVVLGAVAVSLGITAYLHRLKVEEAEKAQAKKQPSTDPTNIIS